MINIDQEKLSQEVKQKYSVDNNTFFLTAKNDVKDKIEVEIGDSKQPEFLPQLKIKRWDNEVNLSIRLKENDTENAIIKTEEKKIIWEKEKIKIEFEENSDENFKLIWYLKSKPATNKIEFSMKSKELNFFYQPPLTEKYKTGYNDIFKREIIVTETEVKDKNNKILVKRPEEVVGSFAIYHKTKGVMNRSDGKDYKVGEFGLILPPIITDSNGETAKGKINIDLKNKIYSVEIPQEFLDKAVYPIKGNDVFGYVGKALTQLTINDKINGTLGVCPESGTADSITVKLRGWGSGEKVKCALYDTSYNLITNGETEERDVGGAEGNYVFNFNAPKPTLSAQNYWIVVWGDNDVKCFYAFTMPETIIYQYSEGYDGSFPSSLTSPSVFETYGIHIWVTYTPSGPTTEIKSINGLAIADVKSINGLAIADVKSRNGLA